MSKTATYIPCLHPSPSLLSKLGSIIVHVEELTSGSGHPFDKISFLMLIEDEEVKRWLKEMDELALLPKKRL